MYYAHFGLKQPPFKITPNTEFFFSGGNRGAVLDALIYAITTGEGIVKVVGEVGSGKTMLCRMLQTLLPEKVESIYLANPSMAPEDVLHAIAFELQLKLPKSADRLQVMQALQTYLLDRHVNGKQVVIFVEEAQGMPLATLEEIRLLSNLETKHDKLLQIVLFGQPELDVNLNQTQIRQLRERITHSFNLGPLQEKEIAEYLIFRLRAAGYFGPHLFSKQAIRKLSKAAQGLVRRVNILADKSLLSAFADNVYLVTPKHVHAAIKDSEFGAEQTRHQGRMRIYYAAAATILLGLSTAYLIQSWPTASGKKSLPTAEAKPAPAPAMQAAPAVAAQPEPAITQPSPPIAVPATNVIQKAEAVTVPTSAVAVSTPQAVAPIVNAVPKSAPVVAASSQPSVNNSSINASTPTPISSPAVAESKIEVKPESKELLEQYLSAGKTWLTQNPPSTVTVQLMGGGDEDQMRSQLASLTKQLDPDKIYLFRTREKGRPFIMVTYGGYQNWNQATQAMQKLPKMIRANRPKLRTVGGIMEETKQFQ
ncbi:MAG TPA: AAA family ATPase [Methylophilaceae bacterium]